jgi:hypothetical protein
VVSWHHFFLLLFDFGFAFGFALSRNAFAVGAPFSPGLRMRSPDPAFMRLRLLWIFFHKPDLGLLAILFL